MKPKYILIYIVASLFCLPLFAQEYEKLVVEHARWRIAFDDRMTVPPADEVIEIYLEGDTLLNGKTYKKAYQRDLVSINNRFAPPYMPASPPVLIAALREDSTARKVYADSFGKDITGQGCPADSDYVLYDFSFRQKFIKH